MANKSRASAVEMKKHFTQDQKRQLPNAAWEYLQNTVGEVDTVPPKHIEGYAIDFIQSEPGLSFWPLTPERLWRYEYPMEDVRAYIAEVMGREQKKRIKKDKIQQVDQAGRSTHPRTPKQAKSPSKEMATPSSRQGSSKKSDSARSLTSAPKSPLTSRGPINPEQNRDTSVLVEDISDDDQNEDVCPVAGPSTPSRFVQQFELDDSDGEPEASPPTNTTKGKEVIRLPVNGTIDPDRPIAGLKRRRDGAFDAPSTPATATSAERPSKRVTFTAAAESNAENSPEKEISREQLAREALSAANVPWSPVPQTVNLSPAAAPASEPVIDNASRAIEAHLVPAPGTGLVFEQQRLAQIPNSILTYLLECRNQSIRSSESPEGNRDYSRKLSMVYRDIYLDLESRINNLSHNAPEARKVVTEYCLWA